MVIMEKYAIVGYTMVRTKSYPKKKKKSNTPQKRKYSNKLGTEMSASSHLLTIDFLVYGHSSD